MSDDSQSIISMSSSISQNHLRVAQQRMEKRQRKKLSKSAQSVGLKSQKGEGSGSSGSSNSKSGKKPVVDGQSVKCGGGVELRLGYDHMETSLRCITTCLKLVQRSTHPSPRSSYSDGNKSQSLTKRLSPLIQNKTIPNTPSHTNHPYDSNSESSMILKNMIAASPNTQNTFLSGNSSSQNRHKSSENLRHFSGVWTGPGKSGRSSGNNSGNNSNHNSGSGHNSGHNSGSGSHSGPSNGPSLGQINQLSQGQVSQNPNLNLNPNLQSLTPAQINQLRRDNQDNQSELSFASTVNSNNTTGKKLLPPNKPLGYQPAEITASRLSFQYAMANPMPSPVPPEMPPGVQGHGKVNHPSQSQSHSHHVNMHNQNHTKSNLLQPIHRGINPTNSKLLSHNELQVNMPNPPSIENLKKMAKGGVGNGLPRQSTTNSLANR